MRIEKITDNTIKVTLVAKDFENRGIEAAKLKFNSPACQELLWDIIDHAEIEMGLDGLGDRIIVETVADSQGNCVITVTRSEDPAKLQQPEVKQDTNEDSDMEELLDSLFSASEHAAAEFSKATNTSRYNDYTVFCFTDFESLIGAVGHCPTPKAIPSKLYTYQDCYYLVLSISERNFYTGLRFEEICFEFNGFKVESGKVIPILQEYGKPLMRRSAIQSLINKFGGTQ